MMRKRKQLQDLIFLAVILALMMLILYSGLQILESTVLRQGGEDGGQTASKTITRDGVDYFPRQDITTLLILGIDQFGLVEDSGSYRNQGTADMNILLIFDETDKVCDVLHLNRDTMMELPVLGLGSVEAGSTYGQLALAHSYGAGLADSCENACKAVSNFLYGIPINYYLSMNMDAIAIFNDAVGGVTVEVTEDFSQADASIPMGQVTLMGDQAISYVRSRKGVGDQQNTSRILRHEKYLTAFLEAFRAKQAQGIDFVLEAYEAATPYLVTNCSVNVVSGMVERYGDFRIREMTTPAGENRPGEEYNEFYVDEEQLDQLILRLFYAPK